MSPSPSPPRHPVARRLLLRLSSLGVVLAFVAAGVQLYLDYQRALEVLNNRLEEISVSYAPSVQENLWLDDRERLRVLAQGIDNLPGIADVQVISAEGEMLVSSGTKADRPLERSYDLRRDYGGRSVLLGRLVVVADLEALRKNALSNVGATLVTNLMLLTVLGALGYWQVHALIAGRLGDIAAYARRLGRDGPSALPVPPAIPRAEREDELTDLHATLCHMHRDLTAAYEAMAAGEARYRELFTSSPVPLWEEDFSAVLAELNSVATDLPFATWLDANPEFVRHCAGLVRVIDVNDAALSMHRASSRQELITRLPSIFMPSSYDAFRRQLECIHAGIWDLSRETQVRTLDGEALDIELQWHVPVQHRGNLNRVIVATQDITALKEARRSSEMTLERLMEANAELERFTFVASHDLLEPVRSVISFSQLLQRRLGSALAPDVAEFLDYLIAAAQRMQAQVTGLQDYARAGQHGAMATVALADPLADARHQLDGPLAAAQAQIDIAPLPRVIGDRGQLAQLFRHLLDNALKFSAVGRPLRIQVTARADGPFWRITVHDNGIGIEPAYAATVFELFRRLHGPGELSGAGIGLTLCRRIVERHGGVIVIDTSAPQGTAVVFTLPAAELVNPEAGA